MLQYRVGIFYGGATVAGTLFCFQMCLWSYREAGAFSGLLAFAISFMSGTRGLLGWSWIFVSEGFNFALVIVSKCYSLQIIEGMATVLVGILSFFGVYLCSMASWVEWTSVSPSDSPCRFSKHCQVFDSWGAGIRYLEKEYVFGLNSITVLHWRSVTRVR